MSSDNSLANWLRQNEHENLSLKKQLRTFVRLWDGSYDSLLERPDSKLIQEDDLLIAALAEHLSHLAHRKPPAWANQLPPMKKPTFPGGLSIRALAESPLAFRRRMIFVSQRDFPELWAGPFRKALILDFGKNSTEQETSKNS